MSKYTAKELLNRLPKSYRELNYKTYLNIINNVVVQLPDDYIGSLEDFKIYQSNCMLSILLNMPYDELEQLPVSIYNQLLSGIDFMNYDIPNTYTTVAVKDVEILTYKEYQSLIYMIPNMFEHIGDILELVVIDLTKEDIDKLSIWEVMQIMGKLKQSCKNSLNRSRKSLAIKLMKMIVKEKMKKLFNLKQSMIQIMNFKSSTDGLN